MLDERTLELLNGKNFGTVSTIMPSGHPQTQMMWVDTDGENVIFNTEIHRAKFKNLERNPLVTVMVMDADNPWRYVESEVMWSRPSVGKKHEITSIHSQ